MAAMRIGVLLGVLLAVAMTFAPLAMSGGQVARAAPAHHAEMTSASHCADQPQPDQSKPEKAESCCAAGCGAAATLAEKKVEPVALPKPRLRPAPEQFHRGTLSETATPPPRIA